MTEDNEAILAAAEVISVLESMGVEVFLVGSLASSLHGILRATADADLVAHLQPGQADELAHRLGDAFYASAEAIADAARHHRSFNLIHLATMFKVDVFVPIRRGFDLSCAERARPMMFNEAQNLGPYPVTSAEDVVLKKIAWYREGSGISDLQWGDILTVLRVQAGRLDLGYMRKWATEIGVPDLLEKALTEADLR